MTDIPAKIAARTEAARLAEHRDGLTTLRLLSEPLEPPDPLPVIEARIKQLRVAYARDWQEWDIEAAVAFAAAAIELNKAREVALSVRVAA